MTPVTSYRLSIERSELARTRADRPDVFMMNGREWDLLDEVFAPMYSPSTGVALDFLGFQGFLGLVDFPGLDGGSGLPRINSMLEIGCGTGLIAVTAALSGVERVLAAVRNASLNAARHGVADSVRCVQSDLFGRLGPQERFDLVFWSSNYVLAPTGYTHRSPHEAAYVDPGYATHHRFLAEANNWLTPGGRALLHFSSRGDVGELLRLAEMSGRGIRAVRRRAVREGDVVVEHLLLEVTAEARVGRLARMC
jgi:release factor glutamine methyltransferase